MKKFACLFLAALLALSLCACGGASSTSAPPSSEASAASGASGNEASGRTSVYRCSLGTASIGGNFNVSGTALANVLNKYMDKFEMTAEVTGGSSDNAVKIANGEIEFGFIGENINYAGQRGEGWAKGTKYDKSRVIMAQNPGAVQIVCDAKQTDINNITDLTGKVISNGTTTGGGVLAANEIYPILGVQYKTRQDMGWSDAMSAMGDGLIDVCMDLGGFPAAAFAEFASTHDAKWVPITKEQADAVSAVYPYYTSGTIPAGTYDDMDEDYTTIFTWYNCITSVDTDPDLVYEMLETIYAHKDELTLGAASFEWLDPSNVADLATPLHVGAIRFYEDEGVKLPETAYGPEWPG